LTPDLSFSRATNRYYSYTHLPVENPTELGFVTDVGVAETTEKVGLSTVGTPWSELDRDVDIIMVWFFPIDVMPLEKSEFETVVISGCRRVREGIGVSWPGPVPAEGNGGKAVWSF
jgi:hypothetical protein